MLGSSLLRVKGTLPHSSDNIKLKFAKKIGNEVLASAWCIAMQFENNIPEEDRFLILKI